ncbi:MAG: NAD-glutamate dehydrogenase [Proteobacteria bacterium]|nr:NAD-glutamate dehydrogenase [Pseudomonadota bacterium]
MEKIKKTKGKEVELLLKRQSKDPVFSSLSAIILKTLPDVLWKDLDSDQIAQSIKEYVEFILDGAPCPAQGGDASQVKVRVQSPSKTECTFHSLRCDTTTVEIHVINQPFIYESVRGYFSKNGYRIIGSVHPVFSPKRENGAVQSVAHSGNGADELFINLYIEKVTDPAKLQEIEDDLVAILCCLSLSVGDFLPMKAKLQKLASVVGKMELGSSYCSSGEVAEFLDWLADDNFVLLGTKDFRVLERKRKKLLSPIDENSLGVFREELLPEMIIPGLLAEIEEIVLARAGVHRIISSDFCSKGEAIIYQLSPVEFFSVRHKDSKSGEVRETLILGRLTRGATHWRSDAIPMLREKAVKVMEGTDTPVNSFEYREAKALFNYLPKQEAFYATVDQLKELISNIMSAQGDNEVTLHVRRGDKGRYAMVMATISRNDTSFRVRVGIEKLLTKSFCRPATTWHHASTESRALLFFYFVSPGKEFDDIDYLALTEQVKKIAIGWDQQFYLALYNRLGDDGPPLYRRYIDTFDAIYKDSCPVDQAVGDILKLEEIFSEKSLQVGLVRRGGEKAVLKLYSNEPVPLMKMLKGLENFGLYVTGEQAYRFQSVADRGDAFIFNYKISDSPERLEKFQSLIDTFFEAMVAVKEGRCEDDSLNRLILLEGLGWRAIELLRTLKNYLLQINRTYSNDPLIEVMVRYSPLVKSIYLYFVARFDPNGGSKKVRAANVETLEEDAKTALAGVQGLGDFQVLSTLFDVVRNALRTNFFVDGEKPYISIKFASREISALSSPKPLVEIYVHSPTLEGVHLRGGRVARGGLRWSDRGEDFRTEILGLMKTQMLKNSLIVPEGAKGGFFIKRTEFSSREEQYEYMKGQYRSFISGLLDITDNYVKGKEVHPKDLVLYDDFDPYLVVAADKGTATLSDTANEISAKYNLWLGDAFASGGSAGYDHKKEGITARGAWESVKRHFREMGTDVQSEPFTVVAIGDMAGDVFGNGMLRSDKIKLVAAFNHMHIFLDPDPDPAKSYRERQRLFVLHRSSWKVYDSKLISRGGGIYLRSAKAVPVSKEMAKYLGTQLKEVTGEEMIKLLLKAKVDLLYNGGIGTYVKAKSESHVDVGDKANDSVRVNGYEVRARVIAEGGNLGMTQLGRLEYAIHGGRCNTDAIDNSGGVDMSDHEVNIKIMLNYLMERGEIKNIADRNLILEEMTDQVSMEVLKNSYLQGAVCSMDVMRAKENPTTFITVVDEMEKKLGLNREEEFIPSSQEMTEAVERGTPVFTKPVVSVLLGYQKMRYYRDMLGSSMLQTFFVHRYLKDYFPEYLRRQFEPFLEEHRLKGEIISTIIINKIINQAGIGLLPMLSLLTGKPVGEISKVYIIIESLLNADSFRESVFKLDNKVSSDLQYRYLIEMEDTIAYALRWFVTHQTEERISFDFVIQYEKIVHSFQEDLWCCVEKVCSRGTVSNLNKTLKKHAAMGMPEDLAKTYVTLPYLKDVMDIVRIKEEHHYNFFETAKLYLKVRDFLDIDWLGEALTQLKSSDKWGAENIANLRHELRDYQNGIVISVLNFKRKSEDLVEAFDHYLQEKADAAAEYKCSIDEVKSEGKVGLISVNVLVKKLSRFISCPDKELT